MAENLILCSFLGICSCYDLKLKKIPGWLLYTGILLGALYWGILKMAGQVSWAALPVSLLPGGVILFYSYITEGKIGIGDGLLVMPAGLMQQWQRCTAEIIGACLLTFFLAAGLLQKRKPKYPYPFCTVFSGSGGFGVDNGGLDRSSCG